MKKKKTDKEKIVEDFYEMIVDNLKERERLVEQAIVSGNLPIGSAEDERSYGKLIIDTMNYYVLKYLSEGEKQKHDKVHNN